MLIIVWYYMIWNIRIWIHRLTLENTCQWLFRIRINTITRNHCSKWWSSCSFLVVYLCHNENINHKLDLEPFNAVGFFFFLFFFSLLLLLLFMKISYTSHSLYYKLDVWHRPVADSIRVHDIILDMYYTFILYMHVWSDRSPL